MMRFPASAGQFYPEEKKELEKTIDKLLVKAKPPSIKGKIFGLLLPHAGYDFSGQVAAVGFKLISGKKFDTVVLIGDSHYERFDGVSVWTKGEWKTPLGKVKINEELAGKIMATSHRFISRDSAHLFEHSLEVQLPFLQRILKDFKILPIIFGSEGKDWKLVAKTLFRSINNREILIIASADLSHYLPYKEAKRVDESTLKNVLNLQLKGLNICAIDSAKTLIEIAKLLDGKTKLLKYSNSGDTGGDPSTQLRAGKSKVVGYGAVAFYKEES